MIENTSHFLEMLHFKAKIQDFNYLQNICSHNVKKVFYSYNLQCLISVTFPPDIYGGYVAPHSLAYV